MANKQMDMRKVKQIFKLYNEGVSKREIGSRPKISRNTVTKYIAFFKRYRSTNYEVSKMTLEELQKLFKFDQSLKVVFDIRHEKLPLIQFTQMNQPLATSISPDPGFSWNVGLAYNF